MWWGFVFPKYSLLLGKTLMEISHASLETSVAALGINGQAEEVTVSTDAEFMMMIAHGIYSNKALALIRELLCNARDGHAKAGCLDKPIHVTLTDNLLVVRDHGTGIPNAIFAKTYMTFGKSTKRQSKNETGGFGVGTKVPWAVCDTFSARNWIDKTMTAYSIVKSDPKMKGKPTCTPVMTIPSIEPSGVEVSVPFPERMHSDIQRYLILFADELGIPLVINGTPHQIVNTHSSKELYEVGFVRSDYHPQTVIQRSPFYVRQGDVIYPIDFQDELEESWKTLKALNGSAGCIIFLAEPDSIIPTLSRESLQYTERTIQSIKLLMNKVLAELADNLDAYCERTTKHLPNFIASKPSFITEKWDNNHDIIADLRDCHLPHLQDPNLSHSQNILLLNNMERWLITKLPYLETKTTTGKEYRETMFETVKSLFIKGLSKYTHLDQKRLIEVWNEKANSWSASITHERNRVRNAYEEFMFWLAEIEYNPNLVEVSIPKTTGFGETNTYSISRSYYHLSNLRNFDTLKERFFDRNIDHLGALYVSRTVVISTTIPVMIERANDLLKQHTFPHSPMMKGHLGYLLGARCLRVKATMKASEIAEYKRLIESWGYNVLVLMDPTALELAERKRLAEQRALKKEVVLPFLHQQISAYGKTNKETIRLKAHLRGLSSNPDYKGEPLYLEMSKHNIPYEMRTVSQYNQFVKFMGNDILCVFTKAEAKRAIKEGRRNVEEAFLEFVQWFYKQPTMYEKLFYKGSFFDLRAKKNKYLTKYLFNRVPQELTEQEQTIYDGIQLFSRMFSSVRTYVNQRNQYFSRCCTPEKHYENLFDQYAESHFCDVYRALDAAYSSKPSPQRVLARSIIKNALKGPL